MTQDHAAYERLRVANEHRAMDELDVAAAIAMAEALLTSGVLVHVDRTSS